MVCAGDDVVLPHKLCSNHLISSFLTTTLLIRSRTYSLNRTNGLPARSEGFGEGWEKEKSVRHASVSPTSNLLTFDFCKCICCTTLPISQRKTSKPFLLALFLFWKLQNRIWTSKHPKRTNNVPPTETCNIFSLRSDLLPATCLNKNKCAHFHSTGSSSDLWPWYLLQATCVLLTSLPVCGPQTVHIHL